MNKGNEEVVRRYFNEVWEQGNTDAIHGLLSTDFVDHDAPRGFGSDRDAHRRLATLMYASMSAKHHRILAMVSDGDMVAVRHDMEWTQVRDSMGIPADGKRLVMKGIDMYRVLEGRITESWHCEDLGGVNAAGWLGK
jgi:predicted ester cyclase